MDIVPIVYAAPIFVELDVSTVTREGVVPELTTSIAIFVSERMGCRAEGATCLEKRLMIQCK